MERFDDVKVRPTYQKALQAEVLGLLTINTLLDWEYPVVAV